MGFEDNFLRGIDRNRAEERTQRREQIGDSIESILPQEHEIASQHLRKSAIRIGDFRNLYGTENIERDISEVYRLKKAFHHSNKQEFHNGLTFEDTTKLSEITESYLLRGINESNWIPYCSAIKTSDFDDYKNGLDLVLEHQREDNPANHVGLGIDVTFSATLDKKLKRIRDDIENGTLANLKYFDSPKSHIRGELKQVPRSIVGFDLPTITRLAEQRKTDGKLSENDPIRLIALHQLDMQFRTYVEYAEKINSPTLPTLQRTAQFISLLTKYVNGSASNQTHYLRNNEQITKLARKLEVFADLQ